MEKIEETKDRSTYNKYKNKIYTKNIRKEVQTRVNEVTQGNTEMTVITETITLAKTETQRQRHANQPASQPTSRQASQNHHAPQQWLRGWLVCLLIVTLGREEGNCQHSVIVNGVPSGFPLLLPKQSKANSWCKHSICTQSKVLSFPRNVWASRAVSQTDSSKPRSIHRKLNQPERNLISPHMIYLHKDSSKLSKIEMLPQTEHTWGTCH